ncbi:MAG: DUF1064 domain-containing protein [Muribaculaceae bacterium]|nr:DUF1064 domain-containing protein [Muribaculaceae bacterium]
MSIDELFKLTGGKSSGGCITRRGNKYHARKTFGYDSKKEYRRACVLKALLSSGEISDLREQVKYVLIPTQRDPSGKCMEKECSYYADFVYHDKEGNLVVEDTKGVRTKEYAIKRKLMLQVHGIRITEI